ncbi:universal stress protein [Halomonas sp. McH1-25]|uniref:universal stress protein n=1 Tax=unclassified Halomonas TaxID=2609666 RepID=UPI001EF3DB52|nr:MULTISPECIES: universal stress protein [unclassified Halomonas]MCG7600182.1 universal stress protein [Halomonas sp. McH1-25]MCP1341431.1 universal stress protein [Halomonas sp. FL8]MCP1362746.1 universal stress protein [Halomonas sp. BBD45]
MSEHVTACIDGSGYATAVCDYAAWASQRLEAPLTFLHVLDNHPPKSEGDLSGNIGLGSREHLLEELATLDEKRARVAQEQGRVMLEAARDRAVEDGIADPRTRQRNGELVETLSELEGEIRLLVLGKRGEAAHKASEHLGSNLERVVRALHRPILMVPDVFKAPERVMIAFDGSKTTCKGIETLAASPFLKGLSCHVVTVGAEVADVQAQLDWAVRLLEQAGVEAHGEIRAGEVESTLHAYQREHDIDLLVMGAYGHSRIRHLLVGSTTTDMLRSAEIPLLLLR